jgi:hypothetical protein
LVAGHPSRRRIELRCELHRLFGEAILVGHGAAP